MSQPITLVTDYTAKTASFYHQVLHSMIQMLYREYRFKGLTEQTIDHLHKTILANLENSAAIYEIATDEHIEYIKFLNAQRRPSSGHHHRMTNYSDEDEDEDHSQIIPEPNLKMEEEESTPIDWNNEQTKKIENSFPVKLQENFLRIFYQPDGCAQLKARLAEINKINYREDNQPLLLNYLEFLNSMIFGVYKEQKLKYKSKQAKYQIKFEDAFIRLPTGDYFCGHLQLDLIRLDSYDILPFLQ